MKVHKITCKRHGRIAIYCEDCLSERLESEQEKCEKENKEEIKYQEERFKEASERYSEINLELLKERNKLTRIKTEVEALKTKYNHAKECVCIGCQRNAWIDKVLKILEAKG